MKNKSETFKNWCQQVDKILEQLPEHTIGGMPLEYSDDEFQNCMRKLQQCALKFDDMPIYIINEKVASELVYDQLKGKQDEGPDI
tara:strand:+ start:150 stop:404 length:255 start_codon:yes stop_codon:yes gene_type:complete